MIKGLTPYQIFGKLTSQTQKRRIWCLLERRITDDRSAIISRDSYQFSTKRTYVHQSTTRSLRREFGCIDFALKKIEKGHASLLYHLGFKKHEGSIRSGGLVTRRYGLSKGRKTVYFSLVSPLDSNRTSTQSTSRTSTWRTIMTNCLWLIRKQRRFRRNFTRRRTGVSCASSVLCYGTSVRVPHKDHQPQRPFRRFRKRRIQRGRTVSQEKGSIRPRTARETSWHSIKQETNEPRQLRAISSTAEIIKENRSSNVFVPLERDWEQFSANVERSLADWQPYRKRTLKLQVRIAAKSFNHPSNFELPNKFDEANGMAHQKIRYFGLRCVTISTNAQGKESPTHPAEDPTRRMRWSLGERRNMKESNVHQRTFKRRTAKLGRSKVRRTRWSCVISSITSITWAHTFGKAEKWSKARTCLQWWSRTPEYHLTVWNDRDREQEQRIGGSKPMQEEQQAHPSSSSSSKWMEGGRVRGGINRGCGLKDSPHDGFFFTVWVTPRIRFWRTCEGGVKNTHAAQTTVVFRHLQIRHSSGICKSRLWHFHFLSLNRQVSALCIAHRHSWILLVQCHRLAYCEGSIREGKLLCVHTTSPLRTSNTPWFCGWRRHMLLMGGQPKYENKFVESRRFIGEKRSSHTILGGGNVSSRSMSSSLPAILAEPPDQCYDITEITNPTTMQVEFASWKQHHAADALYRLGGYETVFWVESQELKHQKQNFYGKRRSVCVSLSRSAIQNRRPWTPRIGKISRPSGCERIFRKLGSSDDARKFIVFGIDVNEDWKRLKEEWHKWLDPKLEMLYVVKEAMCCMHIKFFVQQEKKKNSSWKARCSRSCSHTT